MDLELIKQMNEKKLAKEKEKQLYQNMEREYGEKLMKEKDKEDKDLVLKKYNTTLIERQALNKAIEQNELKKVFYDYINRKKSNYQEINIESN